MECKLITKNMSFLQNRSTTSSRPTSSSKLRPRTPLFTRSSISARQPFFELNSIVTADIKLPWEVTDSGTERIASFDGDMESFERYFGILRECASRRRLNQGKLVHGGLIKCGLASDSLGVSLVDFYAKCADPDSARKVLDEMPEPNSASCTAVISGYVNEGCGSEGVEFYCEMRKKGVKLDKFLVATVLKGCSGCLDLEFGKQLHAEVIKIGESSNLYVGTSLFSVYAKCGELDLAVRVFADMPDTDVVSWTALISGFVGEGYESEAAEFYCDMRKEGVRPDEISFSTVLKCCSTCLDLEFAKQVHAEAIKIGVPSDLFVGTSLIGAYAKCGELDLACRVFAGMPATNVASWNTMILRFAGEGLGSKGVGLYCEMRKVDVRPNEKTLSIVLKCCLACLNLEFAKQVHAEAIKVGVASYNLIVWNSLAGVYTNCGEFDLASRVSATLPNTNVISMECLG